MIPKLAERLRFYFITDDQVSFSLREQVEMALEAGATMVQYRQKNFNLTDFSDLAAVRDICRRHQVPLIINDHVLLAKAVAADGVHLGQSDTCPEAARAILGQDAIIGVSASTPAELQATNLTCCSYIGTGPVYSTATKADAKPVIGLSGLKSVAAQSPIPVVAIGGVNAGNVADCMAHGAAGGAVISGITRSSDPEKAARAFARACGAAPRTLLPPWQDEFALIYALLSCFKTDESRIRVPPGDDAALLYPFSNPVVTTDAQREGVHFRLNWQSMAEIARKAVEITFSDLAACYARPDVLFVNIGVPAHLAVSVVQELYQAVHSCLKRHKAVLGGGNLSLAKTLSLDLFAIGEGREGVFPLRENARPGDGVYVTGPLGLARAGLMCLKASETGYPSLIEHFKQPKARFDAARVLADLGVACVMDISDGLAGDAAHIARASKLTIAFEPDNLPVSEDLAAFCDSRGLSAKVMMFSGGEDYELLFTCPNEVFRQIRRRLPDAFRVGRCLPFQSAYLENLPPGAVSYQHGRP